MIDSLKLYAVTDRAWLAGRTLENVLAQALDGGATFVQLREKHLDFDAFLSEARILKALCASRGVPFVINDDVEIARQSGADGVHVGQSDTAVCEARRVLGSGKTIGASAQTVEQALLAERQGADYLGVGAVFSTSTKLDAKPVSVETLSEICRAVRIPVVAIGGITLQNVHQLAGTPIAGIAVVSALFASSDIPAAARDLRAAFRP